MKSFCLLLLLFCTNYFFNELVSAEKYFTKVGKLPLKLMGITFSLTDEIAKDSSFPLLSNDVIIGLDGKRVYNLHEWNFLRYSKLNREQLLITILRNKKIMQVVYTPEMAFRFYKLNPIDKVEDLLLMISESALFEKINEDSDLFKLKKSNHPKSLVLKLVGQLPGKIQEELFNLDFKNEATIKNVHVFLTIFLNMKFSNYNIVRKLMTKDTVTALASLKGISSLFRFYKKVLDKPVFDSSIETDYDCTISYYLMNYPFPISDYSDFKGIFIYKEYNQQLKSFMQSRKLTLIPKKKRIRSHYFGGIEDTGNVIDIMNFIEYQAYRRFFLNNQRWSNHIVNEFYSNDGRFKECKKTILDAKPFFGLKKPLIIFGRMLIHASDFNNILFEKEVAAFIEEMGDSSLPYLALLLFNNSNGNYLNRMEKIREVTNRHIKNKISIHPLYLKLIELSPIKKYKYLYFMTSLKYGKMIEPADRIYKDSFIYQLVLDNSIQKKITSDTTLLIAGDKVEQPGHLFDYYSKIILLDNNSELSDHLEGVLYLTNYTKKFSSFLNFLNMSLELKRTPLGVISLLTDYFYSLDKKNYRELFKAIDTNAPVVSFNIAEIEQTPLMEMMKGAYFSNKKNEEKSRKHYRLGSHYYSLLQDYLSYQSRSFYDYSNVQYEKLALNIKPNIFNNFLKKKNRSFFNRTQNDNIFDFLMSKFNKNEDFKFIKDQKISTNERGSRQILSLFNGHVYKNKNKFKYAVLDHILANYSFEKSLFGNKKNSSLLRSAYSIWLFKPQLELDNNANNFESYLNKLGSNNYMDREQATLWLMKNKNTNVTEQLKNLIIKSKDLEAIERASAVLNSRVTPDESTLSLNLAKSYYYLHTEDYKKFQEFHDSEDITKNIRNVDYWELRKTYCMSKGNVEAALLVSKKLSMFNEDDLETQKKVEISLLIESGSYKKAIKILKGRSVNFNLEYSVKKLLECYHRLGMFKEAEKKLVELKEKVAKSVFYQNKYTVEHHFYKGDFKRVIQLYEKEMLLYNYNKVHPYAFSLLIDGQLSKAIEIIKSKSRRRAVFFHNEYLYESLIHIQLFIFLKLNGNDSEANYLLHRTEKMVKDMGLEEKVLRVYALFLGKISTENFLTKSLSSHHFKKLKQINERQFYLGFFYLLKKKYKLSRKYFEKCQSTKESLYYFQPFAKMILKKKMKSLFNSKK